MLTITIECDAPTGSAIGVKEDLAMYLERFGDCRVVSIVETQPEQMKLMERGKKDGRKTDVHAKNR